MQTSTPEAGDQPTAHPSRSAPKCIDCRHSLSRNRAAPTSYCIHPTTPVDPVTGGPKVLSDDMRLGYHIQRRFDIDPCGPNGKLFEPLRPVPRHAPVAPASLAAAWQALQAQGVHQSGADAVVSPEEDDQRAVHGRAQNPDHLAAGHAGGQHLHQMDGQPTGEITVLGAVVRQSEITHLLPQLRHMLTAIRRLHDSGDVLPAPREGVKDKVVPPVGGQGQGADDAHAAGLLDLIFSEAAQPVLGHPGETACLHAAQMCNRHWPAWLGHAAVVTLPSAVAQPPIAWPVLAKAELHPIDLTALADRPVMYWPEPGATPTPLQAAAAQATQARAAALALLAELEHAHALIPLLLQALRPAGLARFAKVSTQAGFGTGGQIRHQERVAALTQARSSTLAQPGGHHHG